LSRFAHVGSPLSRFAIAEPDLPYCFRKVIYRPDLHGSCVSSLREQARATVGFLEFRRRFPLILLAAPAAAQQRGPAPLFETPGLAVEAIEAIAKPGRPGTERRPRRHRGQELTLHVQGARPGHIDRWVWMRQPGMLYGSWTRVRGPEPAQPLVPSLDPKPCSSRSTAFRSTIFQP
jgi:hypothetical protein